MGAHRRTFGIEVRTSPCPRRDKTLAAPQGRATRRCACLPIFGRSCFVINKIASNRAILTWQDAVSMVRAAFEGGGAFRSGYFRGFGGVDIMSDTPDNDGAKRNDPPTDEAALSARLTGLDRRLSELRTSRNSQADQSGRENEAAAGRASGMAIGFRLSSELVAGVAVGAVLGWACDYVLPTKPWGLIVFVLLGFTAGVLNVMRAAGVIAKQSDRL
jgi:ATP synthase protein I